MEKTSRNCAFGGNWKESTLTPRQLENVVRTLYKDFGVTEFRSIASSPFDEAMEEAVLKFQKKCPEVKLVYLQKYQENVISSLDYLETRYDEILVPPKNEKKLRKDETTYVNNCKWLAEVSDFTFVYSEQPHGIGEVMIKAAKGKCLFNLAEPPKSWKIFVRYAQHRHGIKIA